MESPGILLTILAFFAVIGPLVFVHEQGHYWAGRLFGIKADAFSIGFGREIAGWTDRRGTRWKLGWLPLGGYVRFAGDMNPASQPSAEWLALPAEERRRTFQAKPVWQRAIVVAAGPAINFLFAILVLAGFAYFYGVNRTPATIGVVEAGSPAAQSGLRPGDRIVALGGRSMTTFVDLAQFTTLRPGETVTASLVRDGRSVETPVTIGVKRERDRFGNEFRIGRLGIGPARLVYARTSLWQAPLEGTRMTAEIVRGTVDGLAQIVTGRRSIDELGGPAKIAKLSGEQMALGWAAFIWFAAMLSINLGFINLLPVPMLDGGHLLFYGIEAIRRRPVDAKVQEWAFRGGLAALLALMIVVTLNDLGSFGLWKNLAGLIG